MTENRRSNETLIYGWPRTHIWPFRVKVRYDRSLINNKSAGVVFARGLWVELVLAQSWPGILDFGSNPQTNVEYIFKHS